MCLCSMCCIYVPANIDDVGASMANIRFVYSIAGQMGSSFVPSPFAVCI
jgi:hypothetical protein